MGWKTLKVYFFFDLITAVIKPKIATIKGVTILAIWINSSISKQIAAVHV